MTGFLLDTNIVSEFTKPSPDANVARWISETDEELVFLSVLTIGEIRKGIARLPAGARRSRLERWFQIDLRHRFAGRILPVDDTIADRWGTMSAAAEARGRKLPVVDGLIAATAQHHHLILVTRNTSDVSATGLPFVNPWA